MADLMMPNNISGWLKMGSSSTPNPLRRRNSAGPRGYSEQIFLRRYPDRTGEYRAHARTRVEGQRLAPPACLRHKARRATGAFRANWKGRLLFSLLGRGPWDRKR